MVGFGLFNTLSNKAHVLEYFLKKFRQEPAFLHLLQIIVKTTYGICISSQTTKHLLNVVEQPVINCVSMNTHGCLKLRMYVRYFKNAIKL